jgi:hypothetical protein
VLLEDLKNELVLPHGTQIVKAHLVGNPTKLRDRLFLQVIEAERLNALINYRRSRRGLSLTRVVPRIVLPLAAVLTTRGTR